MVDVRSVDPTITVDLRYAGRNNFLRHSLYPHGTHALVRPEIASALAEAQGFLRRYQYGLKIWDAYRPVAVQAMLWEASHNSDYVANPGIGAGSLHSWGIAVDATLVDSRVAPSACQATLTILLPLQCGLTWVPLPRFARNVRLLRTRCTRLVFADYALNGGISPSLIGKNTCRLKKRRVPHKSSEPAGRRIVIDSILRGLRQPEYVHVLLNPVPVYGLLVSWIGLIIAFFFKSRRAQIATLALVFITSLSAWPVYEFGQQGYDRVFSMTDEDGERWLDEHQDRAEDLIWIFYALAILSAAAIAAPIKWPKSSAPLLSGDRARRSNPGSRRVHRVRRRQNSASRIS